MLHQGGSRLAGRDFAVDGLCVDALLLGRSVALAALRHPLTIA